MEAIKEKTKNLCAQIPEALHARVREEQQNSGLALSEYMALLITEYYERKESANMKDTNTRTLALQISTELFDELDRYLAKHKLTKKEFITALIREALEKDKSDVEGEE